MTEVLLAFSIFVAAISGILSFILLIWLASVAGRARRLEAQLAALQHAHSVMEQDVVRIRSKAAQSGEPAPPVVQAAGTRPAERLREPARQLDRVLESAAVVPDRPPAAARRPAAVAHAESQSAAVVRSNEHARSAPGFWQIWEKRLSDNWTGILGSVILVAGVAFLGLYAALKIGPVFRFTLIVAISLTLFGLSVWMSRKAHWRRIAQWLRSAAGAVLLIACVGAVRVPGLQWIHNETLGMLLVAFGVLGNMLLAWFAVRQSFASLHTILSLLALLLLPRSALAMSLVGTVSFFAVLLAWRAKWEYHLLQSVLSFLCAISFYGWYYHHLDTDADGRQLLRWIGIASTSLVSAAALLLHYRKLYASARLQGWPFLAHCISWAVAGAGYAMFTTGSRYNTLVLFGLAIAVFGWARRARVLQIRWLYQVDTLVSLAIALLAAISLGRWDWDGLQILLLIALILLPFVLAAFLETEELLRRIGVGLLFGCWLVFALFLIVLMVASDAGLERGYHALMALVMLGVTMVLPGYNLWHRQPAASIDALFYQGNRDRDTGRHWSLSGFFSGVMLSLFAVIPLLEGDVFYLAPAVGIALVLLLLRHLLAWPGLLLGAIPFLPTIYAVFIYNHSGSDPLFNLMSGAVLLFLLTAALLLAAYKSNRAAARWQALVSGALLALQVTWHLQETASPYSDLLPAVLFLLLSLLVLELFYLAAGRYPVADAAESTPAARWSGAWLAREVWQFWALGLVGLFLVQHLFIHLQSELLVGPLRLRLLIQVLAALVFTYWALSGGKARPGSRLMNAVVPLFWELVLVMITIGIALESSNFWLPVLWALLALGLFFISRSWPVLARMRLHATVYFWLSVIHTSVISSANATPSVFWADQQWLGGLAAIGAQLTYIVLSTIMRGGSEPANNWLDRSLAGVWQTLQARHHSFVFYPFYLAVALFLYWSFDSSILTLLWMVEVFIVFSIGLYLGEEHFRYSSLAAMLICLVRLVFWDLQQSSMILRAIVFLGVGALMILMHLIYTRYQARFAKEISERLDS
ncbi:MAG: DUF2339 domain-containing protein [Leptospiraceae bacterium]|nr:DUF2339 domain-containing protein [Leptospiraceae bacterium]